MLRSHRRTLIGGLFSLVAAALVLLATFLPLFAGEVVNGRARLEMSLTAWGMDMVGSDGDPTETGAAPVNAYPMVMATVLLLAGAMTALAAARSTATVQSRRAAVMTHAVAVAFTAATVLTVALQAVSWADSFRPTGSGTTVASSGVGAGFWLMIIGAVFAVAAVVLVALPVRQPAPAQYESPGPVPPAAGAQPAQQAPAEDSRPDTDPA